VRWAWTGLSWLRWRAPVNAITNLHVPYKVNNVLGRWGPDICALLGCYAASSGKPLPTFRDNVSVPSSTVKKPNEVAEDLLASQEGLCSMECLPFYSWFQDFCAPTNTHFVASTARRVCPRNSGTPGTDLPYCYTSRVFSSLLRWHFRASLVTCLLPQVEVCCNSWHHWPRVLRQIYLTHSDVFSFFSRYQTRGQR
jgi:hypothetical protein